MMGWHYLKSRKVFQDPGPIWGPENVIGEDQMGNDRDRVLYYPNVSSCTTITLLLDDGALIGGHLTTATLRESAEAVFREMVGRLLHRKVVRFYIVGAMEVGSGWNSDPDYRWPARMLNTLSAKLRTGRAYAWAWRQPQHSGSANTYHYKVIRAAGPDAAWFYKGPLAFSSGSEVPTEGSWVPITDLEFKRL
jgi:hypothetical protein